MKLTHSASPYPKPPYPPKVRFGSAGSAVGKFSGPTGVVQSVFNFISASRTREMIIEDLVGFGALRTAMDYHRGKTYGDDKGNVPAATERLTREGASILTDNLLGGVIAAGLGKTVHHLAGKAYSNTFTNFATLDLFKDAAQEAPDAHGFLRVLADKIAPGQQEKAHQALRQVWDKGEPETRAVDLAKALGRDCMEFKLKAAGQEEVFRLNHLFEDVHWFSGHMKDLVKPNAAPDAWKKTALDTLEKTTRLKNKKLALGLSAALAATFGAPFLISGATRKIFGIENYPGELGLKAPARHSDAEWSKKNWLQKYFPYVYDSLKGGNPLPLALSLAPLPFAAGMVSQGRRLIANPFAKKTFQRMFDFCKGFPWTAPQQIASGFALLITSRLLCARTDNEFRERMVDSFLGWGLWIFGTPIIKNAVARGLDKSQGTKLYNAAHNKLRDAGEIKNLLPGVSRDVIQSTLKANVWIGAISTLATMGLLGIVEPWIGIRWTQWNEKQKQAQKQSEPPKAAAASIPSAPRPEPIGRFEIPPKTEKLTRVPGILRPSVAPYVRNAYPTALPPYHPAPLPQEANASFD